MLKRVSILLAIAIALVITPSAVFALDADEVLGPWRVKVNEPDATQVTIYKCGEKFCGKISWLKPKSGDQVDKKNPDESLRSRKLLGMDMVFGFEFDDDEWSDGKIYNPENGKTYDCKMWFDGDERDILNVKGSVLFIGKTMEWFRVK